MQSAAPLMIKVFMYGFGLDEWWATEDSPEYDDDEVLNVAI